MEQRSISAKDLTEFLREIGIKDEGIALLVKTFPLSRQKRKVKQMIQKYMEDGKTAQEATRITWCTQHRVQKVRMLPVGEKPTEKDFLKL